MTLRRLRVLRELATAGALPQVTRWRPALVGWLLTAVVLAWKADDVAGPAQAATLLRVVAILLTTTVVAVADDPAANVLAPVPVTIAWRYGLRYGLAAAAVAVPWTAALLWVRPGHLAPELTLECAALTAVALAVASGVARWSAARDPSVAAGPAVFGAAALAALLPPRWAMYAAPGEQWRDAHARWAAVLGVALAVLLVALRDPARRRPTCLASRGMERPVS